MIRHVTRDTWFMTSDGKTHLIRQGDRVAIYPPAIHKDPDIFPQPTVRITSPAQLHQLYYFFVFL